MKSNFFWASNDWRFNNDDRRRIAELLNRNEQAISDIERAIGLFRSIRDMITESYQPPTEIERDLNDIQGAITTLSRLALERGTAWALFQGEAANEIQRLSSLQHALEDRRLELAAVAAANNFSTKRGKPLSPHVGNRKSTIFEAALRAASKVGLEPSREGKFAELIEHIYKSIGETGSENDVRDYLKAMQSNDRR